MGNTTSKQDDGAGKHSSTDSKTPLVISVPYSSDPEKDSIRGALRQLSTPTPGEHDAIEPAPPITPAPSSPVIVDELEGHSNVSRPPSSPPPLLRLSQILDVERMPEFGHVRSPSGHLLDREQYLAHPDRPLTLRERQQKILQRVREHEQAEKLAEASTKEVSKEMKGEPEGAVTPGDEKSVAEKAKRSKRKWYCCC